jgi:hypothetical protein
MELRIIYPPLSLVTLCTDSRSERTSACEIGLNEMLLSYLGCVLYEVRLALRVV